MLLEEGSYGLRQACLEGLALNIEVGRVMMGFEEKTTLAEPGLWP